MTIILKNKETLLFDDFIFKCSIGKNGSKKNKEEGDNTTPKGIFNIGDLYYSVVLRACVFFACKYLPLY